MIIRRKTTTHDLATLLLHPDGSRASANAKHRIARSSVVDHRGNWIAGDAGGKSLVKIRKRKRTDNGEGEFIDLFDDEENRKDASHHAKGKQRACNSGIPEEDLPQDPQQLEQRTRQRLAFPCELSFLDPAPVSVSSLEEGRDARDQVVSFPDPASDLLKSIHHFSSCYYRERGQLFDSSRYFRRKKKERYKESQENIHTLTSKAHKRQNTESDVELSEAVDETSEEDEDGSDTMDAEDRGSEAPRAKGDTCKKDMYRAFDGSSLMAIGIVLQEYVAHTLSPPSPRISTKP